MRGQFAYYNISFEKKGSGTWAFAQGEIKNNTGKDFQLAGFRLILFNRNTLLWSGVVKMMDFRKEQTKYFEAFLEGLDHNTLPSITRYEISFESGY